MSIEAYIYGTDDVKTEEKIRVFTVDELTALPTETVEEPVGYFIGCDMAGEGSFTAEIDRLTLLSILLGHKVTNNWLKCHGGVMSRKIHRRYFK